MADEDIQIVMDETREEMEKSIKSLRIDLSKVRTGRANPALLDGLQVDYYGTPTPLQQLANLGSPDPRLIVISPYDKGAIGEIEKAIRAANLGLSPQNDGKLLRIPIPALTEERRKELVKQIKKTAEEHKIGVREARRAGLAMLKDLEGDGDVTSDDRRRVEKQIQDLTDAYVTKIDEAISRKETEILEV